MIYRALVVIAVLLAASLPRYGFADDGKPSQLAPVVAFLKQHVIGKTLAHEATTKLFEGTIETEFSRRITFTNLVETANGFCFDQVARIEQTVYDLDGQGKRKGKGRDRGRTVVGRYEVAARKSTGELLGLNRLMTNTERDPTGSAYSVRFSLDGDKLVVDETTVGYNDYLGKEGRDEPGAAEVHSVFQVSGGKLQRTQTWELFRVDPKSGKKTPRETETMQDRETK